MSWQEDQEWERQWWGDCLNTFAEETKQLTYAYKMGLSCYASLGKWPCYDLKGTRVLDIGGGPVSMLLKCENRGRSQVVDPCKYPNWITYRYLKAGIEYVRDRGENIRTDEQWDEVWIYNVLQHTDDPELIVTNAKNLAPIVRLFEWIDIPPCEGHPQELKEESLNKWLNGTGTVEWLNENHCYGKSYYGVFKNDGVL